MVHTVHKPNNRSLAFDANRIMRYGERMMAPYPQLDRDRWHRGVLSKLRSSSVQASDIIQASIMTALELVTKEEPDWKFVAAHSLLTKLYKEAALHRNYKAYPDKPYGDFYKLITRLCDLGIYRQELLEAYTPEQIRELGQSIQAEYDQIFDYIGLLTLAERYLATDFEGRTMELPQERYMIIAMYLMHKEPAERRAELAKEAYWAMANLYMTAATPTMANAGKKVAGQLSSCFIDTVDDSLEGIFESNTDVARLSKMGGGIGVYLGKIRARGSDIRGHKNTSSGVIPWIRQLNNTAVSVDQLGTRKGAIAVYLDVFHKDILSFLDLKLNNGDERMRAHDIFHGVCLPDLFMEAVENRDDWHLFCPHEVKKIMGWKDEKGRSLGLEDFYDELRGQGQFRDKYAEAVANPSLPRITLPAIDIMKRILKSQLETGTPYMFYKDAANRANPNKAHGMIYSSNLCTEIMQNMSPTLIEQEELTTQDGQSRIIISKLPGDFVVCNLNSIHLARAVRADVLERLIPIQVRMLDNVIDINRIEVLQAQHTNRRYRAIGLGTFGLHHLLALEGIAWESEEAVQYNDTLYEKINYLAIQASMKLAKEKGAYPLFAQSEWENGRYFSEREYTTGTREGKFVTTEQWRELAAQVQANGMRNAWLMAVAPNGSTSIIAGSTASIDPVYDLLSYEEKTTYKIANPAPDLSEKTIWYYKTAFRLDQNWSIRMAAARQRHIDQAQSFNLYVRPDIRAVEFLSLHLHAWKAGLKSTYYVRSQALTVEECEACSS
ncbi:ribonucleoside-diphosphate reductase subunit alpha [Paenibacillus alvei]|uniref:Ribonucleoside-diphosphate reductase n=1 Tax=Paenibacillus alvei TaxID=44250 RepID=A0ABT4GXN3_PAEAL|nr:ribonucleoside-diphosphate reductase subunit alpha [Paenibacillus alvei]MCY9541795.1 ribonucleoside-diphosphate reductase subunit alpha [Paenibacillus alvei]MCY9705018.1 ribonucleoside-diphosphate reductase subunit alpha [Paenibacillus alvei]MCY9734694.1 ribonucleoside-diphosphate reductase subunit alpha [Paenibacillus alvei]MCY9753983.1 ribonucleoside-diphosphate reductase subunit alpha [Paenibacillus alvei]MCY9761181.1 ribonucleoside-diphosphate reductase subunit alpha [Paenibacillus alve